MALTGKNSRGHITVYDDIHKVELSVDSQEEVDFVNFCVEAVQLSVIQDFTYQPGSFKLFDGVDYTDIAGKKRCMFRDHEYSPDFMVTFDPNAQPVLAKELKTPYSDLSGGVTSAWIDTKGSFNLNSRSFAIDRKWVWQRFGIYICEVIPKKFFKVVGCPIRSFYTRKTNKARKIFAGCRSLKETLCTGQPSGSVRSK